MACGPTLLCTGKLYDPSNARQVSSNSLGSRSLGNPGGVYREGSCSMNSKPKKKGIRARLRRKRPQQDQKRPTIIVVQALLLVMRIVVVLLNDHRL